MSKEERTEPKQASQETDSLVKRLAGPSTGKAGYYCFRNISRMKYLTLRLTRLAKDQTEINRIIADASKGSKFYEVGDAMDSYMMTQRSTLHAE